MRLVQRTMFGARASQTHLAEVLLSGLVVRCTPPLSGSRKHSDNTGPDQSVDAENIAYRLDADVRELLRPRLELDAAVSIVRALTQHIEERLGEPVDFAALVPDTKGQRRLPTWAEPFAVAGAALVEQLGLQSEVTTSTVFISYSHDTAAHSDRVLELSNALRAMGVDAELDRYHPRPTYGWPRWYEEHLRPENAKYVVIVCTQFYRNRVEKKMAGDEGRGVFWEGNVIYEYIYDSKSNMRFIPVLLGDESVDAIPVKLRTFTHFRLKSFGLSDIGFTALYRALTGQVSRPGGSSESKREAAPTSEVARLAALPVLTSFAPPEMIGRDDKVEMNGLLSDFRLVRRLVGLTGSIRRIAWSPDGSRLASGGFDHAVHIWDVQSGAANRSMTGHTGVVYGVSWGF